MDLRGDSKEWWDSFLPRDPPAVREEGSLLAVAVVRHTIYYTIQPVVPCRVIGPFHPAIMSLFLPQSRRGLLLMSPFTNRGLSSLSSSFRSASRLARTFSGSVWSLRPLSTNAMNENDPPVVDSNRQCLTVATTTVATTTTPDDIIQANKRYAGRIVIRPVAAVADGSSKGWGLFALTSFAPQELVMRGTAIRLDAVPDSHSVQIDWTVHAQMDAPARYINHCCGSANVGIRPNEVGAYDFVAIRSIAVHDELLWDYETSEDQIRSPFVCHCGTDQCRGTVRGFRYHAAQVVAAYGTDYIAPFLGTPRPSTDKDD